LIVILIVAISAVLYYNGIGDHGQPAVLYNDDSSNNDSLENNDPLIKQQRPMIFKQDDFEQLSPWQTFVTPNNQYVIELAASLDSVQDVYSEAVSWTWVSDDVLHGQSEKWILPGEFISQTPSYDTNPVKGRIVSDCEEQAYTLVSLLRAFGVPASDVRVVVGKVMVGGETGGHAWVELLEGGVWMQLEATTGPYWDENANELVLRRGGNFRYYLDHSYPVVEVWGYFNDMYYFNPTTGEGNAPQGWIAV